jgi:hypothetical protein
MSSASIAELHANQIHSPWNRMAEGRSGTHGIRWNPQVSRDIVAIPSREKSRNRTGAANALNHMMKRSIAPQRDHTTITLRCSL